MYTFISEPTIFQYFGEDDSEMIREMVQIIIDTNVRDLQELEELYSKSDFKTIKKRCHRAKPSMSYIGALKTRKVLEEIENDIENSKEKNAELQKHLLEIEKELLQFLKTID